MSKDRKMDGSKTLWHMDKVLDRFEKGKWISPVHIDMGISKFCNVDCVFCYGVYQNMSKDYISKDALLGVIEDASEVGIRSLAFIGDGEPTCNPHMYDALNLAGELGLDMSVSTNGVLITKDQQRDSILDNCEWMRFCIAAGDREGYKKIHQVDKFDKLRKNIENMVNQKHKKGYTCDIGLQAVYVPGMMDEDMKKEAQLAVKLGVDYFLIKQCSLPEGNKKVGQVEFDVNEYDSLLTKNILDYCESKSTDQTKIIVKRNTMARKGCKPYDNCPSISLISEMSGNGDWYPCGYMFGNKTEWDEYKFGNVHDKRLKDILYSEDYWNIIEKMENDFDNKTQCVGSCRQDHTNEFIDNYRNKPKGINFI